MANNLVSYFINFFRDTPFPNDDRFTEEELAFFEYGNDILLAYRGSPDNLFQAVKVYWATNNGAYARAGAANVLAHASYIGGGTQYAKEGLAEAMFLIENAKIYAPNRYEIEYIEATIYLAQGDMQSLELALKNLRRFDEASKESGYARLQMRYWDREGNLEKARQWYKRAVTLSENENDVRQASTVSRMAGILLKHDNLAEEAITLYRKVVQLDPSDPWAWHNLSLLYYRRKEYGKAGECNRRALDLMPFTNAEKITEDLIKVWEKDRHKDQLKEYPRYLSSSTARSERNTFNWLLTGKK